MKKFTQILTLFAIFLMAFSQAQEVKDWSKMKPEQRKELINKMSPDERMQILKKFRENMLVDELDIPNEKQEDFKNLYNEYQDSQRAIKSRFSPKDNYENLSDEDAKRELEQSFVVAQQMLENRRKYAEKFQRVMRPQQVLQMFQNEGMMRNKVMERKREFRDDAQNQPFRNNNGSENRGQRRHP